MPKRNRPQGLSSSVNDKVSASGAAEITQGTDPEMQAKIERAAAVSANVAAAYTELVRAQQQAWLNYQRQSSIAYFDLIDSQQQAHWKASEPVEKVRNKLMASFATPQTRESLQKRQEIHQDLQRAQSELASNKELQDQLTNARSAYLQANIEATKEAQDRCMKAYWNLLDTLKNAGGSAK